MPSNRRYANNAASTLDGAITSGQTSFNVVDASDFPTLSGSEYFHATIDNQNGTIEIIKVTGVSSNTLTVTRAQDGTSASAFASGTIIELRMIADDIDKKAPLDEDILPETTSTYDLGSSTYKFADIHLSGNINIDGTMSGTGVDINGLTADASPAGASDYVMTYDASAGANKKVLLNDLPGGGGGGNAWSDAVDSDIIPDADGTRDLGATATRFAETYTDALDVTNNIVVGGTVDGRDVATDGTKLDGIEASADVTDETNVTAALDGATLTSVTVATDDKVLIQDTSDADNLKTVTTQSIANLAATDLVNDTTPQLGGDLDTNGNNIQFDDAHGIYDSAGNEHLLFQETASAVNHFEMTNAATGGDLKIEAVGDDVTIPIQINPKGNAELELNTLSVDIAQHLRHIGDLTTSLNFSTPGTIEMVASGTAQMTFTSSGSSLGNSLDVNGNKIISNSNGDIELDPNGTGNVLLGNYTFDADQTVGAGQDNYVLTYDHSAGTIGLEASAGGGGGLTDVVDDTTPQLGGQLDVNGNAIGDGTRELLTFTEDASAVNHVNIENEATGSGPIISAAGDDTNIDLNINAKGTGNISIGNYTFDADQTVGASQDNYILRYDNSGGLVALEEESQIIAGNSNNGLNAGTTAYMGISGIAGDENEETWIAPKAGTIQNFYTYADNAPGTSQTFTMTMRVEQSDSSVTTTHSGASQVSASDTSNTVSVSAGDRVTIKIVSSASATAPTRFGWSFEYVFS